MTNGPGLPLEVFDCFVKLREKKVVKYQESCLSVQLTLMDTQGKEGQTAEGRGRGGDAAKPRTLRQLRTREAVDVPKAFVSVICANSSKTAAFRIIPRLQCLYGTRHGMLRSLSV